MTLATRCNELVKEYHTQKKVRTLDCVDQSALHGLLAKISNLGLPLLLVRRVEGTSEYPWNPVS